MSHRSCFLEKTSLSLKKQKTRPRNQHKRRCMFGHSSVEFLKGVADKMAKAMCFRCIKRSSSQCSSSLGRSKSIEASIDYYRTAAVEDCIEFIHSSFSRSNSLTATPEEFTYTYSFKKLRM